MIHTYRFELDSIPNVYIMIDSTCYSKAIKLFCMIFGESVGTSQVSCIKKVY